MRKFKLKLPYYHVPIGIALLVVISGVLISAEPRINSFPSLYDDDVPPPKQSTIQTTLKTPIVISPKSQLDGADFGKRIQPVLPPASPAQIIKSIAANSKPAWSSIQNARKISKSIDETPQKTTPSVSISTPGKDLVMQNLATGEIYMKRSPLTNIDQAAITIDGAATQTAPKHWSSLDNYLRMIRVSALHQQPNYQTISDEYNPNLHRDRDSGSLAGQTWVQIVKPNDPNGASLILPYPANGLNQQQAMIIPVRPNYQTDLVARQNSRFEDSLNARRIESQVPSRTVDEITRLFGDSRYSNSQYSNNNNYNSDYSIYRPSRIGLQTGGQNINALDHQAEIPETHISRFPDPINQYHQQTFGRAFCHYQNQVAHAKPTYDMYNLANGDIKSQQQLDVTPKRIDVDLMPNAYPSHMAIYNGSQPNTNNYLCGATWIHQSFAVTLASCLHGLDVYENLTIQAGEWNYINFTKYGINPPIKRKIKSISVHPSYKSQNWKDNIALVQFDQPIGVMNGNMHPACQQYSRIQLRANTCWVPARNVTKTSFFDPEGDGETRDKFELNMVELPIKLIPNDDIECQRETKIEAFNFGHPGLICSGEYKQLKKRVEDKELEILGSGIYCDEGGTLNLVSMFHPAGYEPLPGKSDLENLLFRKTGYASSPGLIDLSYYKHWIDSVIKSKDSRSQLSMFLIASQDMAS